eukprot:TRINITY_DN55053_c0_g1_i1.p1 TRINITY_DN55053_c0_g1~~TRINITY_DN55053_c0_g1_i1.p1  ORF type:complete len:167 (-),score=25.26 TRINITY_DN55053_c0_g1_i1:257-757(-)
MGCGIPSKIEENYVRLVWITDHAMSTCNFDAGLCCGLKSFQGRSTLPKWLSQGELQTIVELGAPYAGYIVPCHVCGQPCCQSPFAPDGGSPLQAMRSKFPHLDFVFQAEFIGCDKQMRWEHIVDITLKPGAQAADIPVVMGQVQCVEAVVVGTSGNAPGQQEMVGA